MVNILFFGSFQHYSVQVLNRLFREPDFKIVGVVTTPPRPGDKLVITKTPVHQYCEANGIPVFPLENLDTIPSKIIQPDFIIVAGYGKLINDLWLNFPKIMAINIHQSLLPNYAGRFPAQWAILRSETETGVTAIHMSSKFDQGDILAQSKLLITPTDTSDSLYTKLYDLSATVAIEVIHRAINHTLVPHHQTATGFYARQLTKEDGYFTDFKDLDNMIRALNPWPGVWTYVVDQNGQKLKMKVISVKIINKNIELEKVLIDGKKPTFWSEIKPYYSLAK
jgi:methionyl-tRNA formyltransferase